MFRLLGTHDKTDSIITPNSLNFQNKNIYFSSRTIYTFNGFNLLLAAKQRIYLLCRNAIKIQILFTFEDNQV